MTPTTTRITTSARMIQRFFLRTASSFSPALPACSAACTDGRVDCLTLQNAPGVVYQSQRMSPGRWDGHFGRCCGRDLDVCDLSPWLCGGYWCRAPLSNAEIWLSVPNPGCRRLAPPGTDSPAGASGHSRLVAGAHP